MATADDVNADLQAFKSLVPSLEDLATTVMVDAWPDANGVPGTKMVSGYAATLMVAPIPLKILSVAVSFEYWSFAASDTAYWRGAIRKGSGIPGFTDLAVRTTQNTGGDANGGVTARTAWTWDAAPWADLTLAAGELLVATWSPYGGAGIQKLPATYTIRYRPA